MRGALGPPATGQPDEANQPDEVGVIRGDDLTPSCFELSTVIDAIGVVRGLLPRVWEVRIGVFRLAGVQPPGSSSGSTDSTPVNASACPGSRSQAQTTSRAGRMVGGAASLVRGNRGLDAHKAPMGALELPNSSPHVGNDDLDDLGCPRDFAHGTGSCSGMKGRSARLVVDDQRPWAGIESHGINLPPVAWVRPIPQGDGTMQGDGLRCTIQRK